MLSMKGGGDRLLQMCIRHVLWLVLGVCMNLMVPKAINPRFATDALGGHMLDDEMMTKLEAWVQTHPDSADTPFMNVSTGQQYTVRGLLNSLQASLAGTAVLSETVQAELNQLESWVGGL